MNDHPVDMARKLFIDAGGNLKEWQALTYESRYLWIVQAEGRPSFKELKGPIADDDVKQKNKKYKLSWDQVCEIRKKHNQGQFIRQMARDYEVNYSTIYAIVNNTSRLDA